MVEPDFPEKIAFLRYTRCRNRLVMILDHLEINIGDIWWWTQKSRILEICVIEIVNNIEILLGALKNRIHNYLRSRNLLSILKCQLGINLHFHARRSRLNLHDHQNLVRAQKLKGKFENLPRYSREQGYGYGNPSSACCNLSRIPGYSLHIIWSGVDKTILENHICGFVELNPSTILPLVVVNTSYVHLLNGKAVNTNFAYPLIRKSLADVHAESCEKPERDYVEFAKEFRLTRPLDQGAKEWEIEHILDRRQCGRGWQYLVRWRGCRPEADVWLAASEVQNSDALDEFNKTLGSDSEDAYYINSHCFPPPARRASKSQPYTPRAKRILQEVARRTLVRLPEAHFGSQIALRLASTCPEPLQGGIEGTYISNTEDDCMTYGRPMFDEKCQTVRYTSLHDRCDEIALIWPAENVKTRTASEYSPSRKFH
ncbi:hypothetical protein DFJ58DRAFT_847322 [Suillus subalutaceus]|uniref:uncharacterized protein n=1 Tax=Suillus subalutaceus TaxID=48586 RepID=UPI001B864C3C|nr:uncharacterized protein DFJ58DRAFT_847322 [Suillus subalutaceus]KAG1835866.1 hypothetical protein DFJ58DRAFT_847322 [Suillus subalutaceus]